ncbi:hypothetical protein SLEP1_g44900 [Rubroshorea leprosula]|uniref:Uncharacterized protein n=1 Tax=Rubroshorea leprosula TaxID=152421 RepID=A0AAV5LI02_9ROSI|nr:hypothetical protein SLEP1_g44900 [Rubroshorea leprosula]
MSFCHHPNQIYNLARLKQFNRRGCSGPFLKTLSQS